MAIAAAQAWRLRSEGMTSASPKYWKRLLNARLTVKRGKDSKWPFPSPFPRTFLLPWKFWGTGVASSRKTRFRLRFGVQRGT